MIQDRVNQMFESTNITAFSFPEVDTRQLAAEVEELWNEVKIRTVPG